MIPYCILVIEDDDDRAFMEQLFVDYHRLMYHEIFKLVHNQWAAEDVMQSTLVRLIDKIPELRSKDRNHLVNYIITASKNQSRNYLRDSGRHSTSDLQEFMEYEDPDMDGGAIELQIIKKEDLEELAHIWTQLDDRTRYLLEGHYILMLSFALEGITSPSTRPIRYITILGFLVFLANTLMLAYSVIRWVAGDTNSWLG